MLEEFEQLFGDQNDDDSQESFADEAGAMFQGEAGAKVGTGKVAQCHDQADLPEDRAVAGEESDRREIGGEIDDLGAR